MHATAIDRPEITVSTLVIPYRKPTWTETGDDGRAGLRLCPTEMAVQRVVIKPAKGAGEYKTSREVAARLDVPPELVRNLLKDDQETVLCITTDPGLVVPESSLRELFERGIPCEVYYDAWALFQVMAFDNDPSNGQLVRLAECGAVSEPDIDITGRTALVRFIDNAEDPDYSYGARDGRLLMDEGEYLRAEVDYRLHRQGKSLAWDEAETRQLYRGIPHVKGVLKSFVRGEPLPESWVRLNLAYTVRAAWFLQQRVGPWWASSDWDDVDLAIAWECSLFGENNHL